MENQVEKNQVEKNQDVEQLLNENELRKLSIGEQRIEILFMKGNNNDKQNLQEHFAHLINTVGKLSNDSNGRLVAEAMTLIETASMFATKALFTK